MLWEQEMYTPFSYNKLTENFHFFASDVKIKFLLYSLNLNITFNIKK